MWPCYKADKLLYLCMWAFRQIGNHLPRTIVNWGLLPGSYRLSVYSCISHILTWPFHCLERRPFHTDRLAIILYIYYIPYGKAKEKLRERILTQFSVSLINLASCGAEGAVNTKLTSFYKNLLSLRAIDNMNKMSLLQACFLLCLWKNGKPVKVLVVHIFHWYFYQ